MCIISLTDGRIPSFSIIAVADAHRHSQLMMIIPIKPLFREIVPKRCNTPPSSLPPPPCCTAINHLVHAGPSFPAATERKILWTRPRTKSNAARHRHRRRRMCHPRHHRQPPPDASLRHLPRYLRTRTQGLLAAEQQQLRGFLQRRVRGDSFKLSEFLWTNLRISYRTTPDRLMYDENVSPLHHHHNHNNHHHHHPHPPPQLESNYLELTNKGGGGGVDCIERTSLNCSGGGGTVSAISSNEGGLTSDYNLPMKSEPIGGPGTPDSLTELGANPDDCAGCGQLIQVSGEMS